MTTSILFMQKRALLFALIYLSYLYATERVQPKVPDKIAPPPSFHLPVIRHDQKPIGRLQKVQRHFISKADPVFLGKFIWQDTLRIPSDIWGRGPIESEDVVNCKSMPAVQEYGMNGLQVFLDYKATIAYSEGANVDPSTRIFEYYPVYLVNETTQSKIWRSFDHRLNFIQEAQDENLNWWPVEMASGSYCGHSDQAFIIHPGEFLLFILPKYKGDMSAWLRIRVKNGENIMVSNPFMGTIYPSQMKLNPLHRPDKSDLEKLPPSDLYELFLGSTPQELYPDRS